MIQIPPDVWRVFAQGDEPRLSSAEWRRHAKMFFGMELEPREPASNALQRTASARVVVDGEARVVIGRAREEADLRDALAADSGGGLYDLAERRCNVVWLVERSGALDRAGLALAAVIASTGLGPILGDGQLFGVRTAREKLADIETPYR